MLHGVDAIGHAAALQAVGEGQEILVAVAAGDAQRRAADLHVADRRRRPSFDGVAADRRRRTPSAPTLRTDV